MYRTDIQMGANGKLKAVGSDNATDVRQPLPKVEASNLVTSSKHGEAWKAKAGVSDPALDSLANTQAGIARSFSTLTEIRDKQSPHNTQAQHLDALNADYEKSVSRYATQLDRATEHANSRLTEIDSEARKAVGWDTSDANELRRVIREMNQQDRAAFISDAVANGDGQALAAVLGSHPSLVGITKDQQRAYRQQMMQQNTPQLLALEQSLTEAKATTRDAYIEFIEQQDKVTAKAVRDKFAEQARQASEARRKAENEGGNIGPSSPWDDLVQQ